MTNPNNPFDAIATDASRVNDGRPGKAPVPKKPARTLSSFADLDEAGIGVGYGYQPQEADARQSSAPAKTAAKPTEPEDFYSQLMKAPEPAVAPKDRSIPAAINDTVIDTANAAVGLVKGGVDLFAPDSSVSKSMGDFIQSGRDKQSDKKKSMDRQLQQKLKDEGDDEWAKAGVQLRHSFLTDPLGTVGQIAGNIGPFAVIGKGLQAAKLGTGVRTAISAGLAGGMSAGEVRGNIWERIHGIPDADLMSESPAYAELRNSGVSEEDAKKELGANFSRNLPELALAGLLGGLGGKYGVEGMAAGIAPKYAAGRLGAAAVGFLDEGVIQGGSEQLASNYGLQRALPNQSLTENIGPNIVLEGIPGVAMGAAFGGGSAPAAAADAVPDPLTPVATKAAEPNSPLSKAAMAGQAPAAPEVIDPISVQASEIEGAIRDGGLLQTLRDTGDEGAVGDCWAS